MSRAPSQALSVAILCTVHCTLYTVHSTLYTVHSTLYTVQGILYNYRLLTANVYYGRVQPGPNITRLDSFIAGISLSLKTFMVLFQISKASQQPTYLFTRLEESSLVNK